MVTPSTIAQTSRLRGSLIGCRNVSLRKTRSRRPLLLGRNGMWILKNIASIWTKYESIHTIIIVCHSIEYYVSFWSCLPIGWPCALGVWCLTLYIFVLGSVIYTQVAMVYWFISCISKARIPLSDLKNELNCLCTCSTVFTGFAFINTYSNDITLGH